jgi:hypothetical protein
LQMKITARKLFLCGLHSVLDGAGVFNANVTAPTGISSKNEYLLC